MASGAVVSGAESAPGAERLAEGLRQVVGPGGALKVCSDKPHLVSLGGGRLSTAVTLLPIEEGSFWLGSREGVDIRVEGTGVEPLHCRLENVAGVVTIYPNAPATSVDGVQVIAPTRLSQGCMICIGRSNFFRFNHPEEAQLMRSILPNMRISGVPVNFLSADCQDCYQMEKTQGCNDQKPPLAPRSGIMSGGGRWREMSEEAPKNATIAPILKSPSVGTGQAPAVAQKVFPPGSATTSSPASDVLGVWRRCVTPPASFLQTFTNPSPRSDPLAPAPITLLSSNQRRTLSAGCDLSQVGGPLNHVRGASEPPTFTCCAAEVSQSSPFRISRNCSLEELNARKEDLEKKRKMVQNERLREQEAQKKEQVRLEEILNMCAEYERQVEWEKEHEADKPRSCSAKWNTVGSMGSRTPWQQRVSSGSGGRGVVGGSLEGGRPTPSPSPGSSTTSANSASTSSSSSASSASSPASQQAPMLSSPTTPTVHQNRIKTNGSLPRDKRLQSSNGRGCSPVMQRGSAGNQTPPSCARSPCDDNSRVFTFEASSIPKTPACSPRTTNSLPRHFGGCSREVSGDEKKMNGSAYQCNAVASPPNSPTSPTSPSYPTYPQSPRTRIRTIAASKNVRSCCDVENRHVSGTEDGSITPHQSGAHPAEVEMRVLLTGHPFGGTLPRSAVPSARDHMGRLEQGMSLKSNTLRASSECDGVPGARGKSIQEEAEELKRERGKLLVALAAIKRKMNDIERQREEALRELEMEQALLEGELSAVTEGVIKEEAKVEHLSKELIRFGQDTFNERELTRSQVFDCQGKVEEANSNVMRIEDEILSCKDPDKVEKLKEQLKHHQEMLEAEIKAFEDMEFHLLEREASWEVNREGIAQEVSEASRRARAGRHRMEELEREREEAATAAEEESVRLKAQQELLISRLNEGRHRLKTVEKRLNELSRQGVSAASWECSPDGSSDPDESPPSSSAESSNPSPARKHMETVVPHGLDLNGSVQGSTQRKQSQDDLDRISRVTSGAPIDVSNGGSLGRRTLESLRTIERNRQIHLEQQGSQVIEEERRRVEELKRRAQDEVRAKWEEGRLRHAMQPTVSVPVASPSSACSMTNGNITQVEGTTREKRVMNCRSLNSVGSEEDSSIAGSDVPTESASSEDGPSGGKNRPNIMPATVAAKEKVEAKTVDREVSSNQTHKNNSSVMRQKEQDSVADLRKESAGGTKNVGGNKEDNGDLDAPGSPLSDGSECEGRLTPGGGVRMRNRTASSTSSSSASRLLVQQQRPLTRYLPIRGVQLDLRAHVEWAGHQPDLCPHVELTSSACRGHLLKAPASLSAAVSRRSSTSHSRGVLSGFRGGSWSRRWFVFDRVARCFSYYTDASEKKSRGAVDFEAIEEVYVDHLNSVKSPSPQLTFCVKTRERTFHLVAPSAEAMRIWVDVIFTGAEGYTQFYHFT